VTGLAAASDDGRDIGVMRDELATIPDVIEHQLTSLGAPIQALVGAVAPIEEVVLTGCGDSYFAGIAARLAFERIAGVRCRAVEALELARYEVRYVPKVPAPLLVAVSYSGAVGRTIEATAAGDRFGWQTVALTGTPGSGLARAAGRTLVLDIPTRGLSPGTSTYAAALAALLMLAAELAKARGRSGAGNAFEQTLAGTPRLAGETLAGLDAPARTAAAAIAAAPVTTFLGAGPSRGTAAFGAAKLFEGAQRYGVAQDLEEWAHEQFFASGPGTPVVVIAPAGPSHSRAVELIAEMQAIGAPTYLVSDGAPPATLPAGHHLPVAGGLDEAASGLLTMLPMARLGLAVSEILGTRSYGFVSEEHEREHYETIHRVAVVEPA
jgi:glucosamine--fructose-6-phosphate aminotransferase (isomerizing)